MTHVRTTAAIITTAIAIALAAHVGVAMAAPAADIRVQEEVTTLLSPLAPIDDTEIIDGVRIVADSDESRNLAEQAVDKFSAAGFPLTNTEIRFEPSSCDGKAGYHAFDRGHHVVVMCSDAAWTMLHELGHVWSDLYLEDAARDEWLERRGVASWSDGHWHERGTEHAANIIAFGLHDTQHVPTSTGTSYAALVDDFEWLMGMTPIHRS